MWKPDFFLKWDPVPVCLQIDAVGLSEVVYVVSSYQTQSACKCPFARSQMPMSMNNAAVNTMQCSVEREKTMMTLNPRRKCKSSAKERQGKSRKQNSKTATNVRSLMHRVNAQIKQKAMPHSMRKQCRIVKSSSVNREFFWS